MTTATGTPRLAYRPEEAARALSCSRDTIFKMLASGQLHGFKIGAARFISAEELERFVRLQEDIGE